MRPPGSNRGNLGRLTSRSSLAMRERMRRIALIRSRHIAQQERDALDEEIELVQPTTEGEPPP